MGDSPQAPSTLVENGKSFFRNEIVSDVRIVSVFRTEREFSLYDIDRRRVVLNNVGF